MAIVVASWLERSGTLDALELTAGSSLLNPMYLFKGDVPLREFAAALRAFTQGPAWASFAESRRGMIREGFDADLTAFAEDVLAVPAEALPRLAVTHAMVAGRLVIER